METPLVYKFRGWFIWFLPAFFMFYQYGVQISPSLQVGYIKSAYLINDFKISLISVFYILAFIIFQIPAGILIDKYNVRIILFSAVLAFSLGVLCVFLSNLYSVYFIFLLGRFIMGMAASVGSVGSIYIASTWLDESAYKIAISLTKMLTLAGALIIGITFNYMTIYMDWPRIMFINIFVCLLLAFLMLIIVRDKDPKQNSNNKDILKILKNIVKNKNLWLISVFLASISVNIVVLTNTWRIDFLENRYHLANFQAIIDNGYTLIGYIVGAPIFGFLASAVKKLTPLMILSSLIQFASLIVCHYFVMDLSFKIIFYLILGISTSSTVLGIILLKKLVNKQNLATSFGAVNMLSLSISLTILAISGELLNVLQNNYILAMTPVIIFSLLSVFISVILWLRTRL